MAGLLFRDLDRLGSKLKGTLRNSAGQRFSAQEGRALGVVQLALLSQGAALLKKPPRVLVGRSQKHDLETRRPTASSAELT